MSVAEMKAHREDKGLKYRIFHCEEAYQAKLPGFEKPPEQGDWGYHDSYRVLFMCENGEPVEEVFRDRMEPEDAILCRDLKPLVDLLNEEAGCAS
jgi:hypothetical protein